MGVQLEPGTHAWDTKPKVTVMCVLAELELTYFTCTSFRVFTCLREININIYKIVYVKNSFTPVIIHVYT